jgi:signal peptidase I
MVLIGESARERGDKLFVDRATFTLRPPRRWETVVFRCPQDARGLCVKRLVGLPGESVQFDRGDLFINGELQRKSLDEQMALRVPVHRERAASRWWRPLEGARASAWVWSGRSWEIRASGAGTVRRPGADADWLQFSPPDRRPVTDRSAYNAGAGAIENATGDLMLTFRVAARGSGVLWIDCGRARDASGGDGSGLVAVSPRRRTAWTGSAPEPRDEQPPAAEALASQVFLEVCVSLFDRQLVVAVDGDEAVRRRLANVARADRRPLAISAAALDATLHDLAVWRDVVYTDRPGGPKDLAARSARWQLGDYEYFVVGDNPAISEDSRTWRHGPGLRAELIVGRPLGAR